MPSKSPAQHRLMEAVKHSSKFAERVKIPQSVGREFVAADAAQHDGIGGTDGTRITPEQSKTVPHGYGR